MATTRRSARLSTSSVPSPSAESSTSASKRNKTTLDTSKTSSPKPTATTKKRKASTTLDNDGFTIPTTPKRNRATTKSKDSPVVPPAPETPTPALAHAMAIPYSSGDIDDSTPPPPNRLANPLTTNATLISPMTSRLVAHNAPSSSPSKLGKEDTTDSILEKALKHLVEVDPRLKDVIEKHHCRVFAKEGLGEVIDPFRSLSSGIISQQVSGAAAKSIKNRFIALFNQSPGTTNTVFPTPTQVANTPLETLRTAGLSQRKAEYIQGLATKFANGELTTEFLLNAEYEQVVEELVKVRGLGRWSVEMFACFGLKRMDVFSTGDLGVQRGMAALEGRDVSKLKAKGGGKWKYMSEKEMLEISSKFAPYRSVFMWYMWRVEDVDVSSMESTLA